MAWRIRPKPVMLDVRQDIRFEVLACPDAPSIRPIRAARAYRPFVLDLSHRRDEKRSLTSTLNRLLSTWRMARIARARASSFFPCSFWPVWRSTQP